MMSLTDFLAIGIVGVALSLFIQVVKGKFGGSSGRTKLITLGLAVVVGTGYTLLRETAIFQTVLEVLASASTVYAFFFKPSTPDGQ
jgi:hypothetical protein